jgi:hypothetical protein
MPALMKVVNLEAGLPTVEQARSQLTTEIANARRAALSMLKIIHGYGSRGVGGALREGLQGALGRMKMSGEIRDFIAGEDWRVADENTWELVKRFPSLKEDADLGRGNRGITVIVL